MKPVILTLCMGLFVTGPCEYGSQQESSLPMNDLITGPEAEIAGIQETGDRAINALRERDLDTLVSCFSEDAVLIPMGHPVIRGRAAIRTFYSEEFSNFVLDDIGPSMEEVVVSGDWAFTRGSAIVVGHWKKNNDKIRVFNRGMEIWNKGNDGTWRIARAIGNRP